MKELNQYIQEKLIVNNTIQNNYKYHPQTKEELVDCIKDKIKKEGLGTKDKPLDLNDIDTSNITDMSELFDRQYGGLKDLAINGYFDVSNWDVSKVINMSMMFYTSTFNGDISDWDVSNVKDMAFMFAKSKFTGKYGDISKWDVSNVENMNSMFFDSDFNGDISKWNVSNVENMKWMFSTSAFNGNISDWNVSNVKDMNYMFYNSPLEKNPPKWYKP